MSKFDIPKCDVFLCTHHREGNICVLNRTSIDCWDISVLAILSTQVCEARNQVDRHKLNKLLEGK